MTNLKRIVIVSLVAAPALILSACNDRGDAGTKVTKASQQTPAPAAPAAAQGSLNVYCSVQLEWCQALANEFARQSGIKVAITQKGSGEIFARSKSIFLEKVNQRFHWTRI